MRNSFNHEMRLGSVAISQIQIDPTSRDGITRCLLGLHHAYCDLVIREKIFDILENMHAKQASLTNGRPGMDLWSVLVLGLLRLTCNMDYPMLSFQASTNTLIQQFLGHSEVSLFNPVKYPEQTIRDNLSILTPEAMNEINLLTVNEGHNFLEVEDVRLDGKCDSYAMETNVHFPTDLSLAFDAVRKTIELTADIADELDLPGWRQSVHNASKAKDLFNMARRANHRKKKDDGAELKKVVEMYIEHSQNMLDRARETLSAAPLDIKMSKKAGEAWNFMETAELLIDQMRRRILNGETIPHDEKIFSVFEQHTEWISKGKAGKPQELGVRLCILQDQYQFILHYKIMWKLTDEKVGVEMVEMTKIKFPLFNSCSFDKGFHSPYAQEKLKEFIDSVFLPAKGKLSHDAKLRESTPEFVAARKAHPAIESAINALEHHGLDRCPDHGKEALERYVALGILARNFQILGKYIAARMLKKIKIDQTKSKSKILKSA